MKHTIKTVPVALAAIMAVSSLTFVSCEKENDAVTPKTEQVAMGRTWSMLGTGQWLNVNGGRNGVYLEVKFKQRGDDHTYYYKGKAVWDFSCRPGQFMLFPDGEEPSRLVWFVLREYTKHLLYE